MEGCVNSLADEDLDEKETCKCTFLSTQIRERELVSYAFGRLEREVNM